MNKIVSISIITVIVSLLVLGCGKKGKPTDGVALKSSSLEVSAKEPKEPAEYSSSEEIKKDVERFQEAISSQDSKKCEEITGSDLKQRCAEKLANHLD